MQILWPMLLVLARAGDIFEATMADGTPSFTDSPRDSGYTVFLREKPLPPPARVSVASFPLLDSFDDLFVSAARRHGVPPELLKAVCLAESGMNPGAVSRAGAQGLMQLMPATAAELRVTDPFDPAQSIDGGARYLSRQLHQFRSPELALAAYNAGPEAVRRARGIPPFSETRAYVPRVMALYDFFRYQHPLRAEAR